MLKIIATESGNFPEVERLNPRFIADSMRLKLRVDTTEPAAYYLENFPHLLYRLIDLFPNLRRHDCSAGDEMKDIRGGLIAHHLLPIKIVGGVIDTAHLLEHLIIELQCSLAHMPMCSGITCALWEPENRFDVFVECENAALGVFAGRLGVGIVNEVLHRGKMSAAQAHILQIAPLVLQQPKWNASRLARKLDWSMPIVRRALRELRDLEFPFDPEIATSHSHQAASTL